MNNIYDDKNLFDQCAKMSWDRQDLSGVGEWHQFKALFSDLDGKSVLDLGCGYDWHRKYTVECGAKQMLGIDLNEKMIQEANEKNADPKITYRICGLDEYDYPADSHGCIVSNLVLHYIADIDSILRKIYSTLKSGGIFLLNIEHPVSTAGVSQDWIYDSDGKPQYWSVDDYFRLGERVTRFPGKTVIKQHHTLTQILMGLVSAGFRLEVVEEAMSSVDSMKIPGMSNEMRRPMMLLIKAQKQG